MITINYFKPYNTMSARSVVVNMVDGNSIVSEFDFQSYYYVHFQMNVRGNGRNYFIPQL